MKQYMNVQKVKVKKYILFKVNLFFYLNEKK